MSNCLCNCFGNCFRVVYCLYNGFAALSQLFQEHANGAECSGIHAATWSTTQSVSTFSTATTAPSPSQAQAHIAGTPLPHGSLAQPHIAEQDRPLARNGLWPGPVTGLWPGPVSQIARWMLWICWPWWTTLQANGLWPGLQHSCFNSCHGEASLQWWDRWHRTWNRWFVQLYAWWASYEAQEPATSPNPWDEAMEQHL